MKNVNLNENNLNENNLNENNIDKNTGNNMYNKPKTPCSIITENFIIWINTLKYVIDNRTPWYITVALVYYCLIISLGIYLVLLKVTLLQIFWICCIIFSWCKLTDEILKDKYHDESSKNESSKNESSENESSKNENNKG